MPRVRLALLAVAFAAGAGPAGAAEITLGLGRDDFPSRSGDGGTAVALEVRSDPLGALGPVEIGVGAALETDATDDLWGGAGVVARIPFREVYRLEASVMAGIYWQGDGIDLGHPLEFRSRLGVSRTIAANWRLGLAFEHKSNAGAGDANPGIETLFATVSYGF